MECSANMQCAKFSDFSPHPWRRKSELLMARLTLYFSNQKFPLKSISKRIIHTCFSGPSAGESVSSRIFSSGRRVTSFCFLAKMRENGEIHGKIKYRMEICNWITSNKTRVVMIRLWKVGYMYDGEKVPLFSFYTVIFPRQAKNPSWKTCPCRTGFNLWYASRVLGGNYGSMDITWPSLANHDAHIRSKLRTIARQTLSGSGYGGLKVFLQPSGSVRLQTLSSGQKSRLSLYTGLLE